MTVEAKTSLVEPLAADATLLVLALNHDIAVAQRQRVGALTRAVNVHEQVEVGAFGGWRALGECEINVRSVSSLCQRYLLCSTPNLYMRLTMSGSRLCLRIET